MIERECRTCGKFYPLSDSYFHRSPSSRGGLMQHCKPCANKRKQENRGSPFSIARNPNGATLRPLKENEICGICFALPHRVQGPRCWRCALPYRPEPPLDLRDYLFRTPDREIV